MAAGTTRTTHAVLRAAGVALFIAGILLVSLTACRPGGSPANAAGPAGPTAGSAEIGRAHV